MIRRIITTAVAATVVLGLAGCATDEPTYSGPLLEAVPTPAQPTKQVEGPDPYTTPLDYTTPTAVGSAPVVDTVEDVASAPVTATPLADGTSGLRFDRYEPEAAGSYVRGPADYSDSESSVRPIGIDGSVVRACLDAIGPDAPQQLVETCVFGGIVQP